MADSGGVYPAQLLSKVNPEYPYALRAQGHQGAVTLEVTVGADGVPKDIRVTKSDPAFDAAVLAAVRQWRFAPARQNGQAVESTVTLPISFRLE
jgi:protein TonB